MRDAKVKFIRAASKKLACAFTIRTSEAAKQEKADLD
jgi:hypothetical protein